MPKPNRIAGQPIPVSSAKFLADEYGYDQVIIIAWTKGTEWHTTYGTTKEHCEEAAKGIERISTLLREDNAKNLANQIFGPDDNAKAA